MIPSLPLRVLTRLSWKYVGVFGCAYSITIGVRVSRTRRAPARPWPESKSTIRRSATFFERQVEHRLGRKHTQTGVGARDRNDRGAGRGHNGPWHRTSRGGGGLCGRDE